MISAINQSTDGNGTVITSLIHRQHNFTAFCGYFFFMWINIKWKIEGNGAENLLTASMRKFRFFFSLSVHFVDWSVAVASMSTVALQTIDITMHFWLHFDKIGIAFSWYFLDNDNLLINSIVNNVDVTTGQSDEDRNWLLIECSTTNINVSWWFHWLKEWENKKEINRGTKKWCTGRVKLVWFQFQ